MKEWFVQNLNIFFRDTISEIHKRIFIYAQGEGQLERAVSSEEKICFLLAAFTIPAGIS